jgi:hypothetical protein
MQRGDWVRLADLDKGQVPACDLSARRIFDPITALQGFGGGLFMTAIALLVNLCVVAARSLHDLIKRLPRRQTA